MDYTKLGLIGKYKIEKVDRTPIEPTARYFVLRYDKQDFHSIACRAALRTYIEHIRNELPLLAQDLERELNQY